MASSSVPASEIPAYLLSAAPVPAAQRAPWYMNTAPTYAGIFLWFAFYQPLGIALQLGSLWSALLGVVLAGAICYLFFYYVPGMLGMKTGLPLYIVGTSTFGAKGGYFIPGIFMGLLQIGWYSVATYYATKLVLGGLGLPDTGPNFYILAVVWGVLFAVIGALGIGYVARVSQFFPIVPILMLLIGAIQALPHLANFKTPNDLPGRVVDTDLISIGSLLIIQMVVGFFGTAGAVGADFCSNNRNAEDVKWAGIAGIWGAIIFAAGLALITVAGAQGKSQSLLPKPTANWDQLSAEERKVVWEGLKPEEREKLLKNRNESFFYETALRSLNTTTAEDGSKKQNWLASAMLLLFAIGSMAPACFCSFIIGNSLSTMLASPKSRIPITVLGAAVGIGIALTGAPRHLESIVGLVGASFGPVIGAMIADYFLNGGRWSGPREGVNWAGYAAWFIGFLVGICNNPVVTNLLGREILPAWHPTGVYSLLVGCIVYIIMARTIGLPARLEGVVGTESGQG